MDEIKPLVSKGVLYMLQGDKHSNVLVVSIHSLRKAGYNGPIHLAVGDDKAEAVARAIAQEPRLRGHWGGVTWKRWQPPTGPRGSAYAAKTYMFGLTPYEQTVFLDADTLVTGSIDPLFQFGPHGVTLTQFADWKSNGRRIPGRIKPWSEVAPNDVAEMLSKEYPAINTGVIAFDRSEGAKRFFHEWWALTAQKICFICDEIAAQLLFWRHACRVLDSRWNCSPIHDTRTDGVVYHFHGRKHIKREQGRKLWLPWYDEAVRLNLAKIAEWTPAGDRFLKSYLDGMRDGAGQPDDDESEPAEESAILAEAT